MPLSPAERMRKYRERLKQNPEKYEKIKKKHAEYVKSKTKAVKELPDKEKEKLRKIWRNQKRKQKLKKKQQVQEENQNQEATPKKRKTKNQSKLLKNYKTALVKNEKLRKLVLTYRKRLYRLRKSTEKQIQKLQDDILKLTARNEILEMTLKTSYKESKTVKEKQTLKTILLNENVQKTIKKTYVSKLLGLKGLARIKHKRVIENKVRKEIESFYLKDHVSRMTAGKRQCRTLGKKKEQIRYLTDTVHNLFRMYREAGGKYSISTFYKYKPFYVLSPTVQNRETCLCIKHNNVELLFCAMKKYKILMNFSTVLDVIKSLCCDINSKQCMYEECEECKERKVNYGALEEKKNDHVQWSQWAVVKHKYTDKTSKVITTKKTVKLQKEGKASDLLSAFNNSLKLFKRHHFNYIYQQKQYQVCVQTLKPHEALIICDFSENYTCKLGKEVQSKHFGASKNQITLHTGMIFWAKKSQSFCTLSDNNCHEPAAIWAHLLPIINEVRKLDPMTTVIHFYSDGPTSQYRQKKNFYLLNLFTQKLKLDYSTWSFSEAGHGKGVADGIGGTVKRALDRQVAFGRDVDNGSQAYEHLSKCMKLVKIFYIPDDDIKNVQKIVPENLIRIRGTMKIHQVSCCSPNRVQYRDFSCFCGTKRGLCKCFNPKIHDFSKRYPQVMDSVVINISDVAMTDIQNCINFSQNLPSRDAKKDGKRKKLNTKTAKKASFDLIEAITDTVTSTNTRLDCSPKLKKELSPKCTEKNKSDFEVITAMADVHIDSGVDYSPKPKIGDGFMSSNKENVNINKSEFVLPIFFENHNILDLDNSNDIDDIVSISENSNPTYIKDSEIIELLMNEDEKQYLNEAYNMPYLNAQDMTTIIPGTDNSENKHFRSIVDDSAVSKVNNKGDSPIESIPVLMDKMAKDNITLAETDYAGAVTTKTNNKRVSTLQCSSPQKKVKFEILENKKLPKIKSIIKNKTELKPLKAVVSRTLPCKKCKTIFLFYNCMTKCSKCKNFYCKKCILNSRVETDSYICDSCVEL